MKSEPIIVNELTGDRHFPIDAAALYDYCEMFLKRNKRNPKRILAHPDIYNRLHHERTRNKGKFVMDVFVINRKEVHGYHFEGTPIMPDEKAPEGQIKIE